MYFLLKKTQQHKCMPVSHINVLNNLQFVEVLNLEWVYEKWVESAPYGVSTSALRTAISMVHPPFLSGRRMYELKGFSQTRWRQVFTHSQEM
ncbi:unnamed protein product [Arctogadus glacialis]